jgi:endonuclease/exonuclease/phosphatase family metal-dependent hydrolase
LKIISQKSRFRYRERLFAVSPRAMFRMLQVLPILVLVGAAGCQRSRALGPPKAVPVIEHGPLELRLMTFNVRYETSDDKESRSWSQRVVGAVRMIREEAPDVFGIQEALHGQAADLWASLPDYEFSGVGRDDGRRSGEYSGIFYRRDRFDADPSDSGTFWLSDTPEKPGSRTWGNEIPRVASWVRLVDRPTGRGFYVFNTHWDHRHQGSREKAALLIAMRIGERRATDEPVVLLGDFNAVEKNPGIAYLTGSPASVAGQTGTWPQGLTETFQALHPASPARTSLHFWRANRSGTLKVDHILVSKEARVLAAGIRDRDEPAVSDHFPVTARVRFP